MAIRLAAPHLWLSILAIGTCADAYAKTDVLRTHAGRTISWVYRDITIGVDPSAPSRTVSQEGVMEALRAAIDAWNGVPELPVRFVVTSDPEPAVRLHFCRTVWGGDKDDLGKAVFTADVETGEVSSAVVQINECARAFLPPDQAQHGRFDLQAVLTHELGHVLGLSHGDNPDALMYPRGGSAGVRTPKLDDRAALAIVYGTALVTQPPTIQQFAPALRAVEPVSPEPVDKTMPEEVLTAMRIADDEGRSMVIFTCEPMVLPPISSLEDGQEQRPRKSRPQRARATHAPLRP